MKVAVKSSSFSSSVFIIELGLGLGLLLAASACDASGSVATDAGVDRGSDQRGATPISLTPADSLFQSASGLLTITVTDVSGACNYVVNRQTKAGARGLVINLLETPLAPGTYAVTEGAMPAQDYFAQAYFLASDANCVPLFATMPFARSGTLVVDTISATEVTGSYDVTFGNGTTLTGAFRATDCGPLMQLEPTCAP
jgi:hypothetical protein